MIASLPMYDRPSTRAAHDRLWALIREALADRGIAAPRHLTRDLAYHATWSHPDLLLGQVCVRPWQAHYHRSLTVIGASDYGLEGCAPGHYRSVYVMRAGDDRVVGPSLRRAANSPDSHSGWVALRALGPADSATLFTGSHDASVLAVVAGQADLAAIDQQTWRLQGRDLPAVRHLRVIGYSATAPGQTLATAKGRDPRPLAAAIAEALDALPAADRSCLGLRGFVSLQPADYGLHEPA